MKRWIPFLLLGCANEPRAIEAAGKGAPNPPPADGGAGDAGTGVSRRIVEERNPFGFTEASENLLADGDFEFTGRQGQQPWFSFGGSGQEVLNFATGGHCLSGIRCAALSGGGTIIGFVASPKRVGMDVSLYAKPTSGQCEDVKVTVTDLDEVLRSTSVKSEGGPNDAGWCHYVGTSGTYANYSPALFVEAPKKEKGGALIDKVVMLPLGARDIVTLAAHRPSSETLAKITTFAAWFKVHRRYGHIAPPNTVENPEPRKGPWRE